MLELFSDSLWLQWLRDSIHTMAQFCRHDSSLDVSFLPAGATFGIQMGSPIDPIVSLLPRPTHLVCSCTCPSTLK